MLGAEEGRERTDEGGQGRRPQLTPNLRELFCVSLSSRNLIRVSVAILEMLLPHKPDAHAHGRH